MQTRRLWFLQSCLVPAMCLLSFSVLAQDPFEAQPELDVSTLRNLKERLDNLEQENQAIQTENARLMAAFE